MEQMPYSQDLHDRDQNDRKGDSGEVLVVAGSEQYLNTPAIVGIAALRAGCDLARVAAPEESAWNSASFAMDLIPVALDGERLEEHHTDSIVSLMETADCTVIGPGLGTHYTTLNLVSEVLGRAEGPVVVDADALQAVDDDTLNENTVLTPHDTEFTECTGEELPSDPDERETLVSRYADQMGCTILLKGPTDIVSNGDRTETSPAGNPYMAKGGTGDVLAGIAAALIAQGSSPFQGAFTAAQVNGAAGDAAVDRYGRGFLLEELLRCVSDAITPGDDR